MTEHCVLAAERIEQMMSKVRMLIPLAQYSFFKSPPELEFVGQGFFKIVFKYGGKAIKYYKFGRIKEWEREKLAVLSRLETFEQLYMQGTRWTAMEFIEGEKLKNIMVGLNKQAVEKVKEDMLACLALGWSPNDLHFGNFMVEPSGRIRFIDVDLFKDIRRYDKEKQARFRQRSTERIEGLYQKMLGLVREE
jgi:predicted Ser/Thr protein kinase